MRAQERIKEGQAKSLAARRGEDFGSGNLPEPKGDRRDVVARAVGLSGSTYERARQVVEAAQEDPARFGDLPARMDETGKVNGAYNEMRRRDRGRISALPSVADVSWFS